MATKVVTSVAVSDGEVTGGTSVTATADGQVCVRRSGSVTFDALTVGDVSGAGSGTVTSVTLAVPAALGTGSGPVTGSGTLTFSLSTQAANTVFAGPTAGGAATPGFRALVAADLPAGAYAPVGAQYVTLATDATLTGERVLTVTAREIDLTDGGAGGAATLRVAQGLRGAARAYLARHFR